jgi:hypothetical protein
MTVRTKVVDRAMRGTDSRIDSSHEATLLMKRLFVAGMRIGVCVSLMESNPAPAQAQKETVAVTQCLYSGPIGAMAGGAVGEPVRVDVDGDGRGLLIVHKVQTNYDISNPFKAPIFAEKPTCRLSLDCAVSKQGLKDIGVQSTRREKTGDNNVWTRVGFAVALKYDDQARNATCHIVAIDSL